MGISPRLGLALLVLVVVASVVVTTHPEWLSSPLQQAQSTLGRTNVTVQLQPSTVSPNGFVVVSGVLTCVDYCVGGTHDEGLSNGYYYPGEGISGKVLGVSTSWGYHGSASTDSSGHYSTTVTATNNLGTYWVTVAFTVGSGAGQIISTSSSAVLTVQGTEATTTSNTKTTTKATTSKTTQTTTKTTSSKGQLITVTATQVLEGRTMTVFASGTTIITTVTETLEASESGGADAFSWFKSATYDIPNWFIFGLILAVVCYLVYRQVWQKKKRSIR